MGQRYILMPCYYVVLQRISMELLRIIVILKLVYVKYGNFFHSVMFPLITQSYKLYYLRISALSTIKGCKCPKSTNCCPYLQMRFAYVLCNFV